MINEVTNTAASTSISSMSAWVLVHLFLSLALFFNSGVALRFILKNKPESRLKLPLYCSAGLMLLIGLTNLFLTFTNTQSGLINHTLLIWVFLIATIVSFSFWLLVLTYASNNNNKNKNSQNKEALKNLLDMLPTGVLAVDKHLTIIGANNPAASIFEYPAHELLNKPLNILLDANTSQHHNKLANEYFKQPLQNLAMSERRVVNGVTKHKREVSIEVHLYHKIIDEEPIVFAYINNVSESEHQRLRAVKKFSRLKRAMDASEDGFWEWNPHTNSAWFNSAFLKMTDQTNSASPNWAGWQAHIHPDDIKRVKDTLNEKLNQNDHFDIRYRGKSKDGHWHWMKIRGAKTYDEKNHPRLGGTLTNIDANMRAEHALAEKSRFLNEVLNRSICGLYIYNFSEHYNTFINPQYTALTGYGLSDLIKMNEAGTYTDLFHPNELQSIFEHINAVAANETGEAVATEYRLKHKDGHWIWCHFRDSIYSRNEDGSPKEMLGSFFDITPIKERERRISLLAQEYSSTFDQAAVGIAHLSLNGKFLKVNSKLCAILKQTRDELIDNNIIDITHPSFHETLMQNIDALIDKDEIPKSLELQFLINNNQVFWVNVTTSVALDEKQRPSHLITMVENIQQSKEMKLELEESNSALERFAYSASHDLQEPLRKISAFVNALERRLKNTLKDEDALYELDRVGDAAKRMSEMIKSLLDLSRITKDKLQKQPVAFSNLLGSVTQDLEHLIDSSKAQISLDEDFTLVADESAMSHLLMNIISNSIAYAKPNTPAQIHIKHTLKDGIHNIEISDNGRGISNDKAERMFEPFARFVDKTIPGHGMGLAICKQVVKAHGGKISAKGEPDIGLSVFIELPEEVTDARE